MCGIAGWVDRESDLTNKVQILDRMSAALAHRGPDSSGIWVSPEALIAHRRLSVIDPEGGGQPMIRQFGDYKYILTYNGELYNTDELRNELESLGYSFSSRSDTEVLLVSYVHWGALCLEKFNGIYAFGIWDEKERRLFLARDRFGVKPLFYAVRGSSLIFASEIKALLANPLIKAELDNDGLAEIFALGPGRTPGCGVFKNINEVKQAECLTWDEDGIQINRYWNLESHEHTDSISDTIEKVRQLVLDSIRRQFVSDVPVCTFLSGGLDSSAISALAAEYFKNSCNSTLNTYSIDYVDNMSNFKPSIFQPDSDAPWVERMVRELNTSHHYITVDTPQLFDALYSSTEARDLPGMADIDSSLWLFCREVKKDATVALSGECADEVFGGYPWFHMEDVLMKDSFPWSGDLEIRRSIMSADLVNAVRPEEYAYRKYAETIAEVPRLAGESILESRRRNMFYLNFTWFMQTLLDRKDRMSMAHGLEVRVPYCDHRLVQYVWNIPWDVKMMDGREKGLLRKALEGILPNDVLYRKKSPYPKTHNPGYEKEVVKRLVEVLENPSSPVLPLVDKKAILKMAAIHSDYGKPWFGQLMALPQMFAYILQIDYWLRKYRISIN